MSGHQPGFLKLVNDAKTRIKEYTTDEVQHLQTESVPFHFVDVREDKEFAKGGCAQSVHLGKGIIERDIEKAIPQKDAHIVLYCGGGFRSALAADNLQQMGYNNVYSMDGGIREWREKGYPMDSAD